VGSTPHGNEKGNFAQAKEGMIKGRMFYAGSEITIIQACNPVLVPFFLLFFL
jgi:hypothetical protein